MTLEEGLFTWLNQRPELRALAFANGSFFDGTNCRIYPGTIAEGATFPALAFASAGGDGDMTMSGPGSVARARIQFTSASTVYGDNVKLLAVLIGPIGGTGVLHGFSGMLPNGVVVQLCRQLMGPIDQYFAEARLHARHIDFEFVYST